MVEEHSSMVIRASSIEIAMDLANAHAGNWEEPSWNEGSVNVVELREIGPPKILSCGMCGKGGRA
jgi:hypothetical protein